MNGRTLGAVQNPAADGCNDHFSAGVAYDAEGHSHGNEHKPAHGGFVTEVNDLHCGLVATPDVLHPNVRDHGKLVNVSNASAEGNLLAGGEKQEVEFPPAADRLESKASYKLGAGTKAVAVVICPASPGPQRVPHRNMPWRQRRQR